MDEKVLFYLEYVSNIIWFCNQKYYGENIEDEEKVILVEKSTAMTAADKYEPIRGELKSVNKELESNTGYLLNKMNIRHNNMEGKNVIEYVKNLSDELMEK